MALFDDLWMKAYQAQWNSEPRLKDALAKINFASVIGYGFPDDASPRGYIRVVDGECIAAGAYDDGELNWDLRAELKNWETWLSREIGMTGLGLAFSTGKLSFRKGDFGAMISDPRMAGPFIKSFGAMSRV